MQRRTQAYPRKGRRIEYPPAQVPDGKVRCDCGAVVGLTRNRKIAAHHTPRGEPCPLRTSYAEPVVLDRLPPVVMPGQQTARPTDADEPHVAEAAFVDLSRLEGGSKCRECGCWLPGERSICGMCGVRLKRHQ